METTSDTLPPITSALQEILVYRGQLSKLPTEHGQVLCEEVSKNFGIAFEFRKYIAIGGEGIAIKAYQKTSENTPGRDVLIKFCLPIQDISTAQKEKKRGNWFLAGRLLSLKERGDNQNILTVAVKRFMQSAWIQEDLYNLFSKPPYSFQYGSFPQVYYTENKQFPVVVMEYISDANLLIWLELKSKVERLRFFVNLVLMVEEYLHKKLIAHCDLKAENILVKNDKPVIIDFGDHRNKGEENRLTRAGDSFGTPLYLPDDMLQNAMSRGYQTDIYMLGELLVVIWNKREPPTRLGFLQDAHSLPTAWYDIFMRCTNKTARLYSDISELRTDSQIALCDMEAQDLSVVDWQKYVRNPAYIPIIGKFLAMSESEK